MNILNLDINSQEDRDLARKIWVYENRYRIKSRELWNHFMQNGRPPSQIPIEEADEWREVWDTYCHRMALDHRRDEINFQQPLRDFTTVEEKTVKAYENKYGMPSFEIYRLSKNRSSLEWLNLNMMVAGVELWLNAWKYWCRLNGLDPENAGKNKHNDDRQEQ